MSSSLGGRARGIWAGNDASSAVGRGQGMAVAQAGARAGELLLLRALRTGESSKSQSIPIRSRSGPRPRSRRSSRLQRALSTLGDGRQPAVVTDEGGQPGPFFSR